MYLLAVDLAFGLQIVLSLVTALIAAGLAIVGTRYSEYLRRQSGWEPHATKLWEERLRSYRALNAAADDLRLFVFAATRPQRPTPEVVTTRMREVMKAYREAELDVMMLCQGELINATNRLRGSALAAYGMTEDTDCDALKIEAAQAYLDIVNATRDELGIHKLGKQLSVLLAAPAPKTVA